MKWKDVCLPKECGGLGIHDLKALDLAYLMKSIWFICENKESLWVKWVHTVILKGSSICEAKAKPSDSWLWKYCWWLEISLLTVLQNALATGLTRHSGMTHGIRGASFPLVTLNS